MGIARKTRKSLARHNHAASLSRKGRLSTANNVMLGKGLYKTFTDSMLAKNDHKYGRRGR